MNLVLLRHGESEWNRLNLFTGWHDVDVTERGVAEAQRAGELLAEAGVLPTVVHTSVLARAITTANVALAALGRPWLPVRRSWRLNERHYGALTGMNKAEMAERFGAEQVHVWRRSYDVRPPVMEVGHEFDPRGDARYAGLAEGVLPATECLADVLKRLLPYFRDAIAADLTAGHVVLVAAHGNSLRALVKHLDGVSDAEITQLNIPTGVPMCYELGSDLAPFNPGDPESRLLG